MIMRKIFAICAFFGSALCTQAYELVARVSVEDGMRWRFDIELANNDIGFTAFQMDFCLDGEATLRREDMNSGELMYRHSLDLCTPEGCYRVAGYNMGKMLLKGKEGQLFSFTLDTDTKGITIGNITFVEPDGTSVKPDTCAEASDGKRKHAAELETLPMVTYNMKGEKVYRIDSRGISIRNGKRKDK